MCVYLNFNIYMYFAKIILRNINISCNVYFTHAHIHICIQFKRKTFFLTFTKVRHYSLQKKKIRKNRRKRRKLLGLKKSRSSSRRVNC